MLMPRKTKHRKQQRGRRAGEAKGGTELNFGDFGIQAPRVRAGSPRARSRPRVSR